VGQSPLSNTHISIYPHVQAQLRNTTSVVVKYCEGRTKERELSSELLDRQPSFALLVGSANAQNESDPSSVSSRP
jgi:hypothetical protein